MECREGEYTRSADDEKYGDDEDMTINDGTANDDDDPMADEDDEGEDDAQDHGEQK